MHCTRNIQDDLVYIGGSDRRLSRFENLFPIPRGVSYNSYVLLDDKTVLFDTADEAVGRLFFENLEYALGGRSLDYLVVHHMEPDHCVLLGEVLHRWPELKLVCSAKALSMIGQFFPLDVADRTLVVGEGDKLSTGRHMLHFFMAPMVHWPEVMVTYDEMSKTLFTADAFGVFGALAGNIFDDEIDFDSAWLADARRYYANICGKYGAQVQAVLKKAAALDIAAICPLHGPVWRTNPGLLIEKYEKWSTYEPEEPAVVILYATMYGNTENAASVLASRLADRGVRNLAMYDVSDVDVSYLVAEVFRCSHLVLAAPTYNGGLHPRMETLLADMKALSVQNRTVALIENGTWAPVSGRHMAARLAEMKNMTLLDGTVTLKSSGGGLQLEGLTALAETIAAQLQQ
ncbi:FprA family A-type flavoprotein [Agathobaculum sp.]|uniref:FprA family A-type flavoprotein n=1 Tax=Agathobaculum sp. TaxID=2048138 RepID=UPI002A836A6B|nr:FprA family A-type flavoprotein [Agathobaculum sp.]MDY3618563.1 FprA family A-type flavoprotein [Agathobaculum sp.]